MQVKVVKADNTTEYFKIEKLRRSLRRAGASPSEVNSVIGIILGEIYNGIKTQEIYRRAFILLQQIERPAAVRYSLRRALFNLGPTGFPFEKFLGRLFEVDGYQTKVGTVIVGKCAPHEIDIAAYKDTHSFVGEAKFHARPGLKTDLQVVMYSYARLLDLRERQICQEDICGIKEFWLITNTKFTTTAEEYGACVGLKMLSWDYPRRDNLHDRIQRSGLYPITVLKSLSTAQIATLVNHEVIVCDDILKNQSVLNFLHLPAKRVNFILKEAEEIYSLRK